MNIEINNKHYSVDDSMTREVKNRIEINTTQRNKEMEILSEICQERDTSKYGDAVDKVVTNMNKIFDGVKNDNDAAKAELNAVQTIVIERELVKRLNLLGRLTIADNLPLKDEYSKDTVEFEYSYRAGEAAKIQDYHATFPFATYGTGKATMRMKQITAGAVTEYYRMNDTTLTSFGVQSRHAVDEMYNMAEKYMFTTGYELIKNSPLPIKLFDIGAGGISKVKVDEYIGILRRTGGTPTIYGTYTMIMQMENWEGWDTGNGNILYSQAHMDEIRNNGVIAKYRGCPVVLINEGIDMTSISENTNTGQKWYSTILPEGIMYIVPSMVSGDKVLKFGMGGVKSMTGTDINNATIARRWDMSFGSALIPTALPFVGFIGDDRYPIV